MKSTSAVRRAWLRTLAWITICATQAAICLAQEDYPSAMPTPAEQRRAAVGMLLTVLSGLVVVVLLLRWVGKREQRPAEDKADETPFDKVKRHFDDKRDSQ